MITKLLKFNLIYGRIEYTLAVISGVIIMFMMFLQTASVILRIFTGKTITSAYEMIALLFVSCVFLGVSYVQGKKEHISIEILTNKLPGNVKYWFDVLGYLMSIFIVLIITSQTGINTWDSYESKNFTMGLVQIPLWPANFAVFLGMFILLFRLIIDFLLHLISKKQLIHLDSSEAVNTNVNS